MGVNGIYGLSGSGLDIESMVKVGMLGKQKEYDRMYKKTTRQEWLKEAYADVYSDLNKYTNSTLSTYKMSATTMAMSAASSSTTVATATANADAATMSHTVNVTALSSNAYMLTGEDGITRSGAEAETGSKSIYLKDVINISSMADSDTLSFDIFDGTNTATVTLTKDELSRQTLNDLASAIKNAKVKDADGKDTSTGVNVKATYDAANDIFSVYNSASGAENKIQFTAKDDNAAALLNNLNLHSVNKTGETSTLSKNAYTFKDDEGNYQMAVEEPDGTITTGALSGTDASVIIDGRSYTTSTGKLSVANVTYSVASVGTTTVTVTQDTDKIIENVKQFVEDYNTLLDKLTDLYTEQRYSDYDVLTKSQEEAMTEEQVKKWNEKAKSGLLYHNSDLADIRNGMRDAVIYNVTSVDGKYKTMSSIGIESSTDQGHLKLDEDKLRAALTDDPDCVYQLFLGDSDSTDYKSQGIVTRLYNSGITELKTMKDYAGSSSEAADGSTLGDLIIQLQNKMSNFKSMMDAFETKLYKKYDSMEVALSRLGMQMNYFALE